MHARPVGSAVEGALFALSRANETGEVGGIQYERLRGVYETEDIELAAQLRSLRDEATTTNTA